MRDAAVTDPPEIRLEPKRTGGHRRMATLSPRDADRWEHIGARVGALVEPLLGPEVIAPRWSTGPNGLGAALRRARRAAERLADRTVALVQTDVQDFYGSVTPAVVHAALGGARAGDVARDVATVLDGWGSHGTPGLPIGPPASAVLADAVLAQVDAALRGTRFVRWSDDYLIAVASDLEAAGAIERLEAALERVGLHRSQAKTRIVPASGFRWLEMSIACG